MTSDIATPCPPILIVDDDAPVRHAIGRLLCRAGIGFIFAEHGQLALDIMQENRVAAIISDQRMPVMHGSRFLQLAQEVQPEAVRIAMTGTPDPITVQEMINTGGADYFLAKPWDDEELLKLIRGALSRYESLI